ncbi:hypothetical protein GCM10010306_098610 [Streptomyces umbrinus]|nr:hypothetical protein GCM10010306_098610 [Streptomyces umbrinus]
MRATPVTVCAGKAVPRKELHPAALEELADVAPDWLPPLMGPEWGKRYGRKVEIGKGP